MYTLSSGPGLAVLARAEGEVVLVVALIVLRRLVFLVTAQLRSGKRLGGHVMSGPQTPTTAVEPAFALATSVVEKS